MAEKGAASGLGAVDYMNQLVREQFQSHIVHHSGPHGVFSDGGPFWTRRFSQDAETAKVRMCWSREF